MITDGEKIRFEQICLSVAAEGLEGSVIGTMSEKRMHKTLKRYICPDESFHEVRIQSSGEARFTGKESGRGGFIADVCIDGDIFEIQTGGFYPLKPKIEFYLKNTDFTVTVVHPLIAEKWSVWVDPETGETTPRRRSPKREKPCDLLPEIFWLAEHLQNERLRFLIPVVEAEEYRILDGYGKDRKKRATKYERMPIALRDELSLGGDEIEGLLPKALPNSFTATEFSKITGLRGRRAYYALKLLCLAGIEEKGEKKGKSYVYNRLSKEARK